MSYTSEELKSFNAAALENSHFISSVKGKSLSTISHNRKIKSFSAIGFVIIGICVFAFFALSGQVFPALIHDRLAEEFDMQHTDMVTSMELVYQQSMRDSELPKSTISALKEKGVLVGYMKNGEFIEAEKHDGELVMKFNDQIITANDFMSATKDREFFGALTSSSPAFSQSIGYHDASAREVFKRIGTNRNNYTSETDFNELMEKKMGEGSDINVNSVSLVKKTRKNERGETEVYWEYEENGASASSSKNSAGDFINGVRDKNLSTNETDSALYSANALSIADSVSTKEYSSLFYALFMENFSKMKAGDGGDAKVNEAMSFLYEQSCDVVVDTDTAETIEDCGSALEEPSLYAVMSGQEIKSEQVKNRSSERILKTIENQLGVDEANTVTSNTVVSSQKKRGSIGRFISSGVEKASEKLLSLVEPTVNSSLIDNSYKTIKGKKAGKLLVDGAINIGGMLAKQSGGTVGDAQAITEYARVNSEIIAMEREIDRMNRSPFDITSKNTFLGSIVYNLAISMGGIKNMSVLSSFSSMLNSVKQAAVSLMPRTYADGISTYLTSFGDCERYQQIGAKGTVECLDNVTFDTSTYNDPFNDPGFISFVENNTVLENGVRRIKKGSDLEGFIIYNSGRETPTGIIDGGILESLKNGSSSIGFTSDILGMVKTFLDTDDLEKKIASGEVFVNSSSNPYWKIYKYAQRYVSIARAAAALREYSEGTAYQNLRFFEGNQNPVIAVLEEYYASR